MRDLEPEYTYEVDNIDSGLWHRLLLRFEDASYFQTWSFGSVHSGERHLSHLVLKRNDAVVGMAQVRIAKVPGIPVGLGYITRGPMWTLKGANHVDNHMSNLLRALHREYVVSRKLFLRISPNVIDSPQTARVRELFVKEGFLYNRCADQTVVLDLSRSLDEIRGCLGRKWRQTLQSGERKQLHFLEGSDDRLAEAALRIFEEMKNRKRFFGGGQGEAIEVHKLLPADLKLCFLVCTHDGEPVAALGFVTFGSTGVPVVSATNAKALTLNASYVLWWRMIQYYKARGFAALDTGGVNEEKNPGGYYFKTHILGRQFTGPNYYLGTFDACTNRSSELFFRTVHGARERYRQIRQSAARRRVTPEPT